MIEDGRMLCPDSFDRVVVAVDPAGTANRRSDETGIIVAGSIGDEVWILADRSGKYSPHGWAKATESMYEFFQADAIIAEVNFGADMVISNLRACGVKGRVISQKSARGKELRAEPIVGLYEQKKVHHVDVFEDLEAQMTEWVPHETRDSPDRIDALVFAVTELAARHTRVADIASPKALKMPATRAVRHHLQGAHYERR
jgi:phage terminase large subunit-like protein